MLNSSTRWRSFPTSSSNPQVFTPTGHWGRISGSDVQRRGFNKQLFEEVGQRTIGSVRCLLFVHRTKIRIVRSRIGKGVFGSAVYMNLPVCLSRRHFFLDFQLLCMRPSL